MPGMLTRRVVRAGEADVADDAAVADGAAAADGAAGAAGALWGMSPSSKAITETSLGTQMPAWSKPAMTAAANSPARQTSALMEGSWRSRARAAAAAACGRRLRLGQVGGKIRAGEGQAARFQSLEAAQAALAEGGGILRVAAQAADAAVAFADEVLGGVEAGLEMIIEDGAVIAGGAGGLEEHHGQAAPVEHAADFTAAADFIAVADFIVQGEAGDQKAVYGAGFEQGGQAEGVKVAVQVQGGGDAVEAHHAAGGLDGGDDPGGEGAEIARLGKSADWVESAD